MNYGLGRIEAVDERDRKFLMSSQPIPEPDRTWRYWTPGPVMDQGSRPHCVGYSAAQFCYTSPIRTRGVDPTTIYRRAQLLDEWEGTSYDGTSVRAGLKVLQEQGRIERYLWAYSAATVARWLLTTGSVMLGTLWSSGMTNPDKHGIAHPTGSLQGGHAFLCIGVNLHTGLFRCVNSWSERWGQRGRFWLLGEDLELLLDQHGEAAAAIERQV